LRPNASITPKFKLPFIRYRLVRRYVVSLGAAAQKGHALTPENGPVYTIVDKEGDLTAVLEPALVHEGFVPWRADDGPGNGLPDADVLAVHLQEGQDRLCEQVVETVAKRPQVAAVIVADEPNDEQLAGCLQAGVVAYVGMPLTDRKCRSLVDAIRRRLDTRRGQPDGFVVTGQREQWIEITADSRSEVIKDFCSQVEEAAGRGLSERDQHRLAVAIHEMCQNAIEWGNQYDPDKKVRMSYCVMGEELVIKVEDEGTGFDPNSVPDPSVDPEGHILQRMEDGKRPGGYGVHLVKSFMDEITYSKRGNVLIMRKRLAPQAGGSEDGECSS